MWTSPKRLFRIGLVIGLVVALCVLVEPIFAKRFGSLCQEGYQNGWQTTLSYCFNRCSGFNNELDDTDTKRFYWNLQNQKRYFENTWDQYEPETVDLLYVCTHGGGWSGRAVWAMWDQNQMADSRYMRLGDESSPRLSLLATYACGTLKNDGNQWTRYGPIFRGGLRYAVGSHDKLWDGWTTDECGEDFADYLQRGKRIKYAWKDGVSDWATAQDAAVMAVGRNSSDCWSRLDNMTWQNITAYGRLRDGQIGYWCSRWWNNL